MTRRYDITSRYAHNISLVDSYRDDKVKSRESIN
jgi:hypothetical protein